MTKPTVHRCRIPLHAPLVFRDRTLTSRDVVLLSNDAGNWAEAGPLPSFSREGTNDVVKALSQPQSGFTTCPSLQFASDCLTNHDWPTVTIPINALLTGSATEFAKQAALLADSKCRAVKLKVGSTSLEEDIERVTQLRKTLRTDQTLRLDANRAWDWTSAVAFAKAISALGNAAVEYVEEPLKEPERLEAFFAETKCRFALDETLLDDVSLKAFPSATAFVIKPTLLGSIQRIEEIAKLGKPLVFSGCFESGVGTLHIARLAAKFSPDIPAGLDTWSRLADDVLSRPLAFHDWALHIEGPPKVDLAKVAKLTENSA